MTGPLNSPGTGRLGLGKAFEGPQDGELMCAPRGKGSANAGRTGLEANLNFSSSASWSLLALALLFWNQILTWVSVRLRELENSARSAMERYCFWRNLRSSARSWEVVKGVRGFLLFLCFLKVHWVGLELPVTKKLQREKAEVRLNWSLTEAGLSQQVNVRALATGCKHQHNAAYTHTLINTLQYIDVDKITSITHCHTSVESKAWAHTEIFCFHLWLFKCLKVVLFIYLFYNKTYMASNGKGSVQQRSECFLSSDAKHICIVMHLFT